MATTTNMLLQIPESGDSDYPTKVSNSFTAIDDHDHTSGNGVQIPTAGLADSAVTTAKINALAVTRAKQAAVGQQTGNQSGTFDISNTSATDVPGVTATITTTGRPVVVMIYGGLNSAIGLTKLATNIQAQVYIDRDGTSISNGLYDILQSSNPLTNIKFPISLSYIDAVAAGTYTYKFRGSVSDGQMIIGGAIITVYEL